MHTALRMSLRSALLLLLVVLSALVFGCSHSGAGGAGGAGAGAGSYKPDPIGPIPSDDPSKSIMPGGGPPGAHHPNPGTPK